MRHFCYRGQYHDRADTDFIRTRKDHIARLLCDGKICHDAGIQLTISEGDLV